MKFGTLHLFQCRDGDYAKTVRDEMQILNSAEPFGFDAVWLTQQGLSDYGICGAPEVVLAALAQTTTRIRLGTAVVNLPFQHPLQTAQAFALLDQISNGRVEMGVGRGYQPHQFAAYGLETNEAKDRFDEGLEIIKRSWAESEALSFHGRHYAFDNVQVLPKPAQKPRPRLWMAALSQDSYEKAGKLGVNLLCSPRFGGTSATSPQVIDQYHAGLRAAGHDPQEFQIGALCMVHVGNTMQQAHAEFRQHVLWYYDRLASYCAPKNRAPAKGYESYQQLQSAARAADWETMISEGTVICGDPDHVAERLAKISQLYSLTDLIHWARLGGMPIETYMKHLELMRDEVMPALKK